MQNLLNTHDASAVGRTNKRILPEKKNINAKTNVFEIIFLLVEYQNLNEMVHSRYSLKEYVDYVHETIDARYLHSH